MRWPSCRSMRCTASRSARSDTTIVGASRSWLIREAIINAVAHADYSQRGAPIRLAIFDNRIEVENPGLLPFGLTLDDLPQGISKLRNRTIGRVFHELGLVEQWGSGVQRMIATCREAGLAPPVVGGGWPASARDHPYRGGQARRRRPNRCRGGQLGDSNRVRPRRHRPSRSSRCLTGGGGYGSGEIARSGRTDPALLPGPVSSKLVSRGLVREVGTGPHDPKRRYVASRAVLGGG